MTELTPLLEVEHLSVDFRTTGGDLHAVRDVSFSLDRGKTLAIVGESGSGKSVTSMAIMGLLPATAHIRARRMSLDGHPLQRLPRRKLAALRGNKMAMIFQEPMTALNPSYTVGDQLMEVLRHHKGADYAVARKRAVYLLDRVGISAPDERLRQYPHQLSGGLRQRVVIAMALMCDPDLLIADEPTTALDVSVQAQILCMLRDLQTEFQMGMIFVTHDLGVVARLADDVAVMYAGQLVEAASTKTLFDNPQHPYTRGLLSCIPVPGKLKRGELLGTIPGVVPSLNGTLAPACSFAQRCAYSSAQCMAHDIALKPWEGGVYRCVLPPAPPTAEPALGFAGEATG